MRVLQILTISIWCIAIYLFGKMVYDNHTNEAWLEENCKKTSIVSQDHGGKLRWMYNCDN